MSETPRTDRLLESLETHQFHGDAGDVVDFARDIERELAIESAEKMKYRKRAWHAESQLETRYGLRKEINAELGLTDETGDEALRKGLETIKALKAERDALLDARAWRPIETAPKDKSSILIIDSENFITIGEFSEKRGCFANTEECWKIETPTHWMPLPEPPKGVEP